MPGTIDNPTQRPSIVEPKRLTTHCIVVGGEGVGSRLPHNVSTSHVVHAIDSRPFHRSLPACSTPTDAPACLTTQAEPLDAITVAANCQVSAISAALETVTSDLVFFLRCGDVWADDFVARMRGVYQKRPEADVVSCDSTAGKTKIGPTSSAAEAINLGFNAVTTYACLDYLAQPLSCLSMRRRLVERILPLISDSEWDDEPEAYLAIAASLASARKFHLPTPLVVSDLATEQRDQPDFARRLKVMRLVGKIANQLGLNPDFVTQFLVMEYNSRPKDWRTITKFCRLLQSYHPDTRSRRDILLSMYRNMKEHLRGDGSLGGYVRRWWIKQKLLRTGKLAI